MQIEERYLDRKVDRIVALIECYVRQEMGVKWFQLRAEDRARLLQLEVWADRYRVSVKWLLDQLVPFWRQRFSQYRQKVALGVKVPTLVGKKSEELLREWIGPQLDELEQRWRAQEQERQFRLWRREEVAEQKPTEEFRYMEQGIEMDDWMGHQVRGYVRRVKTERDWRQKCRRQMRRRPWRGNPWR